MRFSDEKHMDVFNRDISHYVLEEGMPPGEAERKFVEQWGPLNRDIFKAFGVAIGSTMGTNTAIGDRLGPTGTWSDIAVEDWV